MALPQRKVTHHGQAERNKTQARPDGIVSVCNPDVVSGEQEEWATVSASLRGHQVINLNFGSVKNTISLIEDSQAEVPAFVVDKQWLEVEAGVLEDNLPIS